MLRIGSYMAVIFLTLLLLVSILGCETEGAENASSSFAPTTVSEGGSKEPNVVEPAWSVLEPVFSPSPRYGGWMATDSTSQKLVFVGGQIPIEGAPGRTGGMWEWDAYKETWAQLEADDSPGAFSVGSSLVYDERAQRLLLFYGGGTEADPQRVVWAYDADQGDWQSFPSEDAPYPLLSAAAYHGEAAKTILFGGLIQSRDETWSYEHEAETWNLLGPVHFPPGRSAASMVYRPGSKQMILFGGLEENGGANDLWSYDLEANNWTELKSSSPLPSPRIGFSMIYHPPSGKVVLCGGVPGLPYPPPRGGPYPGVMGDTWLYDPETNTWTELDVQGPPPRAFAAMGYDPASEDVILFGGYGQDGPLGDTWRLEL